MRVGILKPTVICPQTLHVEPLSLPRMEVCGDWLPATQLRQILEKLNTNRGRPAGRSRTETKATRISAAFLGANIKASTAVVKNGSSNKHDHAETLYARRCRCRCTRSLYFTVNVVSPLTLRGPRLELALPETLRYRSKVRARTTRDASTEKFSGFKPCQH